LLTRCPSGSLVSRAAGGGGDARSWGIDRRRGYSGASRGGEAFGKGSRETRPFVSTWGRLAGAGALGAIPGEDGENVFVLTLGTLGLGRGSETPGRPRAGTRARIGHV